MTEKSKENVSKKSKWTIIFILLACLGIYLFVPKVHDTINHAGHVLTSQGLDGVIAYIRQYGKYAALISFFLMILQSIAAPIPAVLITLANAAIFGWWKGALLSWTSAMAGAAICFYIGRSLGRDAVIKLTSRGALEGIENFFAKFGNQAILIARLLPFISFDVVSYAAGLTPMAFGGFFLATGLGQIPATIVYSYVGGELDGGARGILYTVIGMSVLAVLIYIFKKIYNEKHKTNF